MKETMKKFGNVCKIIFGYGIMITLFAGGFTFFGYMAALIIGGDAAALICECIYRQIIPVIVKATTGLIIFGLLCMYLSGEKALSPGSKNKYINPKK